MGNIQQLTSSQDIPTLIKTLIRIIPELNLRSFFLLFYDHFDPTSNQANVILGLTEGKVFDYANNAHEISISPDQLISDDFYPDRRFEWVVESINSHNKQHYGFSIMESPNKSTQFGRLGFHIGAAIQETIAFQEHESLLNAFRQSEARYKLLFQGVTDAIYVNPLSPDGTLGLISETNEVLCERLGYSRDELLHMSVQDFIIVKDGTFNIIASQFLTKNHMVFELVEVAKNGVQIPVEVNASSFDFNGQPSILFITRDITDRKQREAWDLQKSKFEERERVTREFVAKFSHELRNPLNAIIGFAEVLIDGQVDPVSPQQLDFLKDIHASGQYLLLLISEILDLTKIEAGRMEFPLDWFSLDQMLEPVKVQMAPLV